MVATLDRAEATGLGFDVVTWAPTVRRRVRRRGFDQARLLARAVARELGVSARRLLVRADGPSQTGRSRLARLAGPRFRPVGRPRGRVLLVDDVITTGATLSAAAEVLLASGSGAVVGLVAARTALKCGSPTAETSGSHR
jgi:predicted amidophosphoribosyltransferase